MHGNDVMVIPGDSPTRPQRKALASTLALAQSHPCTAGSTPQREQNEGRLSQSSCARADRESGDEC
jgi:hypothetical protein